MNTSEKITITSAPRKVHDTTKFTGTDNPRHLRIISLLMQRPAKREEVDNRAGCSNGPELIAELRRRGLNAPCTRIKALDRDGRECRPGIYHFLASDRRKINDWLKIRGAK